MMTNQSLTHKDLDGVLLPIGSPLPANTPHAVSVSLPTWQSNVGYEEGDPEVVNKMKGGYPRFVFHPIVKKLFSYCIDRFGKKGESCMVFPHSQSAEACRRFMRSRLDRTHFGIRLVELLIPYSHPLFQNLSSNSDSNNATTIDDDTIPQYENSLFIIMFPEEHFKTAKEFWQHTGEGVSSRFAEHCLRLLEGVDLDAPRLPFEMKRVLTTIDNSLSLKEQPTSGRSRFHSKLSDPVKEIDYLRRLKQPFLDNEMNAFVEERFGRNLDRRLSSLIKLVLRRRIAGILADSDKDGASPFLSQGDEFETFDWPQSIPSTRNVPVKEDHVYLFANGMSTIYHIHRLVLALRPGLKTVQFGFPYTDTLKIQQKFGPGCHFLGFGDDDDLSRLEHLLQTERIAALFCEFPSNPLLKSPDLHRIYALSRQYSFMVIVDETIGNFCNISVLPYADIVVSSLTKIFSGDSNVMGGSAVLNPSSIFLDEIQTLLNNGRFYYDNLFSEDAVFLERNSRTFRSRIDIINRNAESICDYLVSHPKVEAVYYPKFITPEIYKKFVRNPQDPGYGGLFSVILKTEEMAIRFYDALQILKGPSLGTNFTLACPYTLLAHYTELDWAAQFGVSKKLIRISVGIEETSYLLDIFEKALETA